MDVVRMHIEPLVRPTDLHIHRQSIEDMKGDAFVSDLFLSVPSHDSLKTLFLNCLTGRFLERFAFYVVNLGDDSYFVRLTPHESAEMSDDDYKEAIVAARRHITACGLGSTLRSYNDLEILYRRMYPKRTHRRRRR